MDGILMALQVYTVLVPIGALGEWARTNSGVCHAYVWPAAGAV